MDAGIAAGGSPVVIAVRRPALSGLFLCFVFLFVLAPEGASAISSVRRTPVVEVVNRTSPAVVNITCTFVRGRPRSPLEQFFGDFGMPGTMRRRTSLGSGVIVDGKKALVLTNAHVVQNGTEIQVRLNDGREFKARMRGADPDFDLAVLELEGARNLPELKPGDSSDLQPGETVIAIGNPFGFTHTVTTGVVSATGRSIETESGVYTDLIQTDAAVNPGNSGGPLINLDGSLVGINTAIYGKGWGIGFAIPINKARLIMNNLLDGRRASPLWLGLQCAEIDQRTAMELGLRRVGGLVVTGIYRRTPAASVQLEPGDVIVAIGDRHLSSRREYLDLLRNQTEGSTLVLEVLRARDGYATTSRIRVKPEAFPDERALDIMRRRWGFAVRQRRGVVVIEDVERGGPTAALRKGDILRGISGMEVNDLASVAAAFRTERLSNAVLMLVERGGRVYYARVQL